MRRFFHDLSPESRRNRFFAAGEPSDRDRSIALPNRPTDGRALTLVACRHVDGEVRIIAVASYIGLTDTAAEVAFAVDDRFQGKGIGTLLLERLAALAAAHGFQRFHATTLADNAAMLEVFRDSGFEIRSRSAAGAVDVQLSLTPVRRRRGLGGTAPAAGDGGIAAADARAARRRRHRRLARATARSAAGFCMR